MILLFFEISKELHFCYFLQLLETLVFGCREADQDLNISYLECLGEIGAIDPGNLPRIIKLKSILYLNKYILILDFYPK